MVNRIVSSNTRITQIARYQKSRSRKINHQLIDIHAQTTLTIYSLKGGNEMQEPTGHSQIAAGQAVVQIKIFNCQAAQIGLWQAFIRDLVALDLASVAAGSTLVLPRHRPAFLSATNDFCQTEPDFLKNQIRVERNILLVALFASLIYATVELTLSSLSLN